MLPIASAVTPFAQLVVRREHPVVAMAVLPRRRDEQASEPEPSDHAATRPLCEHGQIGLRDRPRRQELRRGVTPSLISRRHEDAVGHAGMQVNMVVERRTEAVQKGDATEPRASGGGRVGFNRYDCRSAQQSLDLGKKDFREGRDGWGSVDKKAPQSLRHGDHPLPHGHRRDDVIGEVRRRLGHVAAVAGRADAAALAAGRRQGGPSMAPSCRARLSRAATTNPVRHVMQTARAKPKQSSPHSR